VKGTTKGSKKSENGANPKKLTCEADTEDNVPAQMEIKQDVQSPGRSEVFFSAHRHVDTTRRRKSCQLKSVHVVREQLYRSLRVRRCKVSGLISNAASYRYSWN